MNTITTDELKALQDQHDDLIVVNTLNADSFKETKIPGAVNIPLDTEDFAARVEDEAGGKYTPVVVYCANSQCDASEKAARKLDDAGFSFVSRYTGGAAAWQQELEAAPAGQCC
ncbi:MAG: rhodanese-like domain-containing protein [Planctomycetaceae bacterium]|nr:rhodanese-like domain-containing protein [Planctomycetaceae bacterium]